MDPGGVRARPRQRPLIALVLLAGALSATAVVIDASSAPGETVVHLTAAGDYGARTATATVLQKVAELDPDAHLALGDLAYGDVTPESAWCSYVKNRVGEGFPFELISGNHESLDTTDGLINNYSACLPNQIPGVVGTYGREYYMDFPKVSPLVRVIQTGAGLNFEDGRWNYNQGDAHYNWLSNAIDGGRADGAKWIIVTAHYPCISTGVYSCPNPAFNQLMASKRVDVVLHGHEHSYLRTHQLRSGVAGCSTLTVGTFNASCVADTDNAFVAGQGTVFATVGTGGIPLRDINPTDTEAPYFAASSGLNANPTYGLLDLSITETQLSAGFVPTAGGNFTDAFTITKGAPPPNQPPVAAFTAQVQDRTLTVNGSGSTDDGIITVYNWDFGDGFTATGATPAAHAYATAGTYTVTLTVTDNFGVTDPTTQSIIATDPIPTNTLAEDLFARTVVSGWNTAPLGGAWTVSNVSAFSVNGTHGLISTPAAGGRNAYLRAVSTDSSDVLATLGVNKITTGSGLYASVVGRSIIGAGDYRSVVRFRTDGRLSVKLVRVAANGAETAITTDPILPGITYSASDQVLTRLQVTGVNPTTVRAKVWKAGTIEPTAWALSLTDATAILQAAGSTGIVAYLSGSATNAPIVLAVDDFTVIRP